MKNIHPNTREANVTKMFSVLLATVLVALISTASVGCKKPTENVPVQSPKPTKGSVQGTVRDAETSGYIRSVIVFIAGQAASTDNFGSYKIDSILADSYAVTTSRGGYDPYSGTVVVTAGQTTTYDFYLQPSGPSSHTVTLNSVADSYTSSSLYSTNFGTSQQLYTGAIGSNSFRGFVRFDVSSIPGTAQITKATLKLITSANRVSDSAITTASVDVSEVTGTSWTEIGLTYTNSPVTFNYLYSQDASFGKNANLYQFIVTSAVSAWVSGTHTNRGFSVKAYNIQNPYGRMDDYCNFYPREVSGWGPQLVVEYLY